MNLTLGGGILAVLTGLLGVWIFLNVFATQHTDYRVAENRHACERARGEVDFSKDWSGKPDPEKVEIAKAACAEFQQAADARKFEEVKAEDERKVTADAIKAMLEAPTKPAAQPENQPTNEAQK
jgi:hypothetical protein